MSEQEIKYVSSTPPDDYTGTETAWQLALKSRGHTDKEEIPLNDWWDILQECEGEDF